MKCVAAVKKDLDKLQCNSICRKASNTSTCTPLLILFKMPNTRFKSQIYRF